MGTVTTPTPVGRNPQRIGTNDEYRGRIIMSSSYATGGDTVSAASLGMTKIAMGFVAPTGSGVYFEVIPQTDQSTAKIKAFAAGGSEVASTTDQHTLTPAAIIVGR